ncbi:MEF2-activating motif and SAP domain-containing transcriptional regulator [Dermochelys coriacea]|uniref:MEF2-activating motif and SAP domain-containing transcriptional regulator n=1 Tax=Dermochelys coriacea TaxID=27794 RepID=UPI001CAA39B3|nr:MEF2-activating motif and SAP domain-containing transcriptional regulator [Dermochelys coriacea]
MTLLASERSMLIRSKFRSGEWGREMGLPASLSCMPGSPRPHSGPPEVPPLPGCLGGFLGGGAGGPIPPDCVLPPPPVLQLRMQHRRSQEQHLLTPVTKPSPTYLEVNGTPEQSRANETLKVKVQTRTHKLGAAKGQFTEESGGDPSEWKEKTTRLAEDLKEKLLQRPGPLELVTKNILSLDASLKDAVKADPAPAAPGTFLLDEDLSSSSSSSSSSPCFTPCLGGPPGNPSPPSASGAADQPELLSILESLPPSAPAPDPNSQLPAGSPPPKPPASLPKAPPRPKKAKDPKPKVRKLKYHQYVPPAARPPRAPAPLDAAYARLLQQQQLFLQLQILQQQQPPAPPGPPTALCVPALHPLSASISPDPVISFAAPQITLAAPPTPPTPPVPPKPELLPANLDDLTRIGGVPSSAKKTFLGGWNGGIRLSPPTDTPFTPQVSELRQQLRQRGLPVSGTKPALLERLKPFQVRGAPGPPPPALPPADRALREKQRLIDSLTWELRREQQEADDLREELQLQQCRRGRPEGEPLPPSPLASHGLHPSAGETPEGTAPGREGFLFFCPPSCEPIGEDLELPLQITASPAPASRSLEEELQEAIQKAQLVPSQSIEDILEEPLGCAGDLLPTDAPLLLPTEPRRPPSPLSQQGAPCKKPRRSPSAAAILDFPGHYDFLTPPSSSSSSPSDSLRRVFSPEPPEGPPSPGPRPAFDPVDWLEALTAGPASGLGPGAPGGSSIFSTDFFDSPELSVNHMIDLMVEQW